MFCDFIRRGLVVIVVSGQQLFRDNLSVSFRGSICCSEASVATNLRCVTSQKSEDLVYIVAEAWNRARMQYFGGPVFVFGKFHILWCSSELPGGCWNSTFKWRSAETVPMALNSFVFRLTLYKDLNKIRSKYFHLLRCDAVCLVEIFQPFIGTCWHRSWWWWLQISLRWRNISTELHGVTSQKTASLQICLLTISQKVLVFLTLCQSGLQDLKIAYAIWIFVFEPKATTSKCYQSELPTTGINYFFLWIHIKMVTNVS